MKSLIHILFPAREAIALEGASPGPRKHTFLKMNQRQLGKLFLLLGLTLFTGYLLSPRLLFDPIHYEEGDIIRQTIVIGEDLLLPDHVSTRLKGEQLLKEQGLIYDYDPALINKTKVRIHQAFDGTRQRFHLIDQQKKQMEQASRQLGLAYFNSLQFHQSNRNRRQFYRNLQAISKERLETFSEQETLSAEDFLMQTKLNQDLLITEHLIRDLSEQKKLNMREIRAAEAKIIAHKGAAKVGKAQLQEQGETTIREFLESLKMDMSATEVQSLGYEFYDRNIELELISLVSSVLSRQIISTKQNWDLNDSQKLSVRNLMTDTTAKYTDLEGFIDLEEAKAELAEQARSSFEEDASGKIRSLIVRIGQRLLQPTVTENRLEREKRREELLLNSNPVYFSVKKGEIIARGGDRATLHQTQLIKAYYEEVAKGEKWPKFVGLNIFVLFLLILIYKTFQTGMVKRLSYRSLMIMTASVVLALLVAKGGLLLSETLELRYAEFQGHSFRYFFPIALAAMLVGVLVHFEAGVMAGILASIFVTIMAKGDLYFAVYGIAGSLVAAMPIRHFTSRYSLIFHGLKVSSVNIPLVLVMLLIEPHQQEVQIFAYIGAALASGILSALLVSILLPFFESIFDVTTNLKLLELSNLNNPALKELIQNASGTFHHSVIVGNLAEAGVRRIGGNPLLARVGAYYHDIGKGQDPQYFYENKPAGMKNLHDAMNPLDSAKMIIGHITKGAKLADKYRLGKAIKDILVQHHGDSPVRYFLTEAQNQAKLTGTQVDEKDFCYPGPKPQSLEAAAVMLADMSEAATRSLERPSLESIREMVKKVTWRVLEEGQLDESGLTLKLLHELMDEYVNVLSAIHHNRISYPEAEVKTAPVSNISYL